MYFIVVNDTVCALPLVNGIVCVCVLFVVNATLALVNGTMCTSFVVNGTVYTFL